MLQWIINSSLKNRVLVLLVAGMLALLGMYSVKSTPLDAIPDLSDVQVIVKTSYPGQAPEVIEEQITYPLSTSLMAVPKAKTVRGFSFFGDSYVYVIFEDKTDLYWARARVLEYLNQAAAQLPAEAKPVIGPDASGVGWIYLYALVDRSGTQNLADLRALQDWFLKYELQSVQGVSEIATVGGMVQTYQVIVEPLRLLQYGLTLKQVKTAIEAANSEVGGSVLEMAEAEYMVRSRGYLKQLDDFKQIPLGIINDDGSPLMLEHVATIRLGPQMRRGIAELNGEGEVVGGIVVMRDGENALATIDNIKNKINALTPSLPEGVEIITVYDRSTLIKGAIDTLQSKLIEEMLVVALVCFVFLMHARSTLVAVICLPLAVLIGFILMRMLGINANIMSLGGIAIAIGALVDAAIVMVENSHKHLAHYQAQNSRAPSAKTHWQIVAKSTIEVGPALFFSLLLITVSFMPVFALEAQEGKLFSPLAYTKTFVMAAAALLSITLVPVLIGLLVKGKIPNENNNVLSRILIAMYRPILSLCLKAPKVTILFAILLAASSYYPLSKTGSEFMPELEEGDLLYMPTTLPGVSIAEAGEILQQTDRLIKAQPEVLSVFGKVGRAETATDPAPLTMLETTIQLKPKSQWRAGITLDDIVAELEQSVKFPGLANAWVQPIKTRIDMLSTGVKTPVGIQIMGDNLGHIEQIGRDVERILSQLPGTLSAYAERPQSGRYIDIEPRRTDAAKYGLTIADIQLIVKHALGGANIAQSIQGKERFPINLRYPRRYRDQIEELKTLPFLSPTGAWVTLEQVADIEIKDGPALIKSENGRFIAWTFVDLDTDIAIGDYIEHAKTALDSELNLPPKHSIRFSGQYEYLERVTAKLELLIPLTLVIILIILYLAFNSMLQAGIVMLTLPLALSGSLWFVYLLGYQFSVAVAVGMIALAGVAAEFGVVMLIYLNQALKQESSVLLAVKQGAIQRVRPKAMTVLTIVFGLLPIMLGSGTGNEVMQKIAAPMLGGMIVSPLISMLVIPCVYYLLYKKR